MRSELAGEERAEPALKRRSASSASCIRRLAASTRSFRPPAPPLGPAPTGAAVMRVCVAWTIQDKQANVHLHHAEAFSLLFILQGAGSIVVQLNKDSRPALTMSDLSRGAPC